VINISLAVVLGAIVLSVILSAIFPQRHELAEGGGSAPPVNGR
jgi:hypothetical protein